MILDKIITQKKKEVILAKKKLSLENLEKKASALPQKERIFLKALQKNKKIAVIAEIKRRSPSKGLLCRDFDAKTIARQYEKAGASALSVLTDQKFFCGSALDLKSVKKVSGLPVLRKDFIIDLYQVYESRLMGADAILLIAGILSKENLKKFYATAEAIGLDVLFEVHSLRDIKKIVSLSPKLVGINNRDLRNFKVSLDTTKKLIKYLPKGAFAISESGIHSSQDLKALKALGVRGVLIGEHFMRDKNPGVALQSLIKGKHE